MRLFRRLVAEHESRQIGALAEVKALPSADHAWKVLSVTNEWVRHADGKTAVTLAFVGATAAILFNLTNDHRSWTWLQIVAVSSASVAIVVAVGFAAAALFPRVERREPRSGAPADAPADEGAVNLLFFGDVHKQYAEDGPTYREVLSLLTSDPERLTGQIADQVHANARIATVKFRWVNRAILAELVAVAAVAGTALLIAVRW